MTNVQQIIETAKKQHKRGELTILELEALAEKYNTNLIIDADDLNKRII